MGKQIKGLKESNNKKNNGEYNANLKCTTQYYYNSLENESCCIRFDVISSVSVQCTSLDTVIRWLIAESLLAFVTRVHAPCELPTKVLRFGLLWQYQGS